MANITLGREIKPRKMKNMQYDDLWDTNGRYSKEVDNFCKENNLTWTARFKGMDGVFITGEMDTKLQKEVRDILNYGLDRVINSWAFGSAIKRINDTVKDTNNDLTLHVEFAIGIEDIEGVKDWIAGFVNHYADTNYTAEDITYDDGEYEFCKPVVLKEDIKASFVRRLEGFINSVGDAFRVELIADKKEEVPFRDSFYQAKRIAIWFMKNNKGKDCTTKDIREVASVVFGEEISRRTVQQVKEILERDGNVRVVDAKVIDALKEVQEKEFEVLMSQLTGNVDKEDNWFGEEPFLYDAITEYEDFLTLYEILEGEKELPDKCLVILTYLYNELEDEGENWEARLENDKSRLEKIYNIKVFNSPEKEDAKFLVVGLRDEPIDTTIYVGDSKLTRKHKLWYAGQLESMIDPRFLRKNYRVKVIKGNKK